MVAAAMARQHPVEAVVEQASERPDLCGPGEPAGVAEGSQILLVEAPGQGIAGKETMSVVEIGDAAPGMARDRDCQPAIIDAGSTLTLEDIRGEGCGIAVGHVNPDASPEMPGVALGIGHIIAMRQENIPQAAPRLDRRYEGSGPARRVDHGVGTPAANQERMSAIARLCIVA